MRPAIALTLWLAGCQCGPAVAGSRPLDGGGMDATVGPRDAGEVDAAGRDAAPNDASIDAPFVRPGEILCDDGMDQDMDGASDCADSDCDGLVCDATGNRCRDGSCDGCRDEASETACGDGADEDCDGMRDCADPECDGRVCGPGDVVCAGGACPCVSGFEEWLCGDGTDDDCDMEIDCADSDCAAARCSDIGEICMADGTCACPTGMELCQGVDDDCDGVIDDGCPESIDQGAPATSTAAGGTDGVAWADPCPMGAALIGVAGRSSTRVDQLQPVCAVVRFVPDPRVTMDHPEHTFTVEAGAPIDGALHGGTGGTAFEDRCPENEFVIGVEGHAELALDRLSLRCASFAIERNAGFAWQLRQVAGATTPSRGGPGTGDAPFDQPCGPLGVVTSLEGRATDTHVTSLAVSCRTLALDLR